ncbi:MAG: TlyA family RNA methyltransferase [Burkholderiaceae bacterium]|jgi:23S rRNA (cytidine1920-2'-O)/16S rRNA (cytidine1409-2'-O)-methyltransferase|nr:TlyA family RNA methyltransferase [Burkholderiaceae bacterium]
MNAFHSRDQRRAPPPVAAQAPVARKAGFARADQLLAQRGQAASRTAARELIAQGRVSWQGQRVSKPAQALPQAAVLDVAAPDAADATGRYVSRGGIKLAGALQASGMRVRGACCLDVGQSTGGFTDCLLQHGASRVVGLDVGHGQLHPRLRQDARVLCLEGVNARHLDARALAGVAGQARFDRVVGDVSFISLTLVLPALVPVLAEGGELLMLVKPQFELQPAQIGKGGIVRDAALYADVQQRIRHALTRLGLQTLGWFASPITGGDGNREFFVHAASGR